MTIGVTALTCDSSIMAASAERIDFVNHDARRIGGLGGPASVLVVNFRVFRRGPAHVAGIAYTTDFWVTPLEAIGRFQHFDGDFEVWQAQARASFDNATFEYIIFCRDHRDFQNVRQIYNTNFGNTFQIAASHF